MWKWLKILLALILLGIGLISLLFAATFAEGAYTSTDTSNDLRFSFIGMASIMLNITLLSGGAGLWLMKK